MIRCNIIGFNDSDKGGPRWGDCSIFDDGKNFVIIDGYCSVGVSKLIKRLKKLKCKRPYLYISHAHGDHEDGIYEILKDSYFNPRGLYCYDPDSLKSGFGNSEVKGDADYLKKIIAKAKSNGVPVKYLKHGDHQIHGDIDFYVYRKQPAFTSNSRDPHGWEFINDGSLCFWFKSIGYWTSGDGPQSIGDFCAEVGAKPVFFKIPHHGNACDRGQSTTMKERGARYCWDNDYSTSITGFLQTGREDCIAVKIKYIGIHGDINFIAQRGYVSIYKDYKVYRYKCSYKGKSTLRQPVLNDIKDVLKGEYGNNNSRITNLIDAGIYPISTQNEINEILDLLGR